MCGDCDHLYGMRAHNPINNQPLQDAQAWQELQGGRSARRVILSAKDLWTYLMSITSHLVTPVSFKEVGCGGGIWI